jgi:hypothetical protein
MGARIGKSRWSRENSPLRENTYGREPDADWGHDSGHHGRFLRRTVQAGELRTLAKGKAR